MRPIFALAALLLALPAAHAQDVHTYNSGLPNDAHLILRGHRIADRPIDAVAFTPQSGSSSRAIASTPAPASPASPPTRCASTWPPGVGWTPSPSIPRAGT